MTKAIDEEYGKTEETEEDSKAVGDDSDKELLEEARRRFKLSSDYWGDNRAAFAEDLEFTYVDQWPQYAKEAFGKDSLITINRQISFNRQVTNDMRQNRASIKVRPVDDNADVETAEVLQGLIRHIEANSKADLAYDTADRYAVEGGFGFYRIITDYKPNSFDQEILIKEVDNPLSVLPDYRFSADGSDWEYCFIHDEMPRKDFEKSDMYDSCSAGGWEGDGLDEDGWATEDSVRVCEYFYKERTKDTLVRLEDGRVMFKSDYDEMGEDVPVQDSRSQERIAVKWCKFVGNHILERADWAGSIIPVIPVYGDTVVVNGKHITISLGRYAKDAQRMVNYSRTKQAELEALAPKAPYIMAEGQDEGYESDWENANNTNFSSLKYKLVDLNGQLAPPPQRQNYAGAPAGVITLGQMAEQDMMAIIGIHEAGLGQRSNETSGKAIEARQREGDNSTFNFVDNTTRARRACGLALIDLIPHIYDTPQVVRILGEDDTQKTVMVNEPTQVNKNGQKITRIYDLSVGQYDVICSAGASYSTKRAEGAAFLERVAGANPELMKIIGDLVFKAQDMPYADDISDRLQKTLPPEMRPQNDESEQPQLPPEVMQQMEQANQTIQQMDEVIQKMQVELEDKQASEQEAARKNAIEQEKVAVDRYGKETERMKVQGELALKAMEDLPESEREQFKAELQIRLKEMEHDHQLELELIKGQFNQKTNSNPVSTESETIAIDND